MNRKLKGAIAGTLASVAMLFAGASQAVPVALELVLLVDVSGSVSAAEYDLQKTGYVNAFNDAGIQALIAARPDGIAVTYVEWSSAGVQSQAVGWTHITDGATASAFATSVDNVNRTSNGSTGVASAINFGAALFANNFEGTRLVMDVSGDGAENQGGNTLLASTNAHAAGITLNGLAILGETGLQAFYQNNIVTPGGGFLVVANDFADFSGAVITKIGREITGVPEPTTLALLGLALAGLGFARRKASA